MNTTRTTAALAALNALHNGDQDGVNAALEAAGEKPRDIGDVALLPALADMIGQDVNELDVLDADLADQLSNQQVLLDEPNPNIPEIVQNIEQLLGVIEAKYPTKAIANPTPVAAVALALDTGGSEELPELSDANIDPLDSEEDEPEPRPDASEEDEPVEEEEPEEPLERETEMDAPPEPAPEEDTEIEADGSLENELADPETEEEPESEEDDGDDEVEDEDEIELDGGKAVLALAGALATGAVSREDARDYIESLADEMVDDDAAAALRRVHEALGDVDYTDTDVVKKLNTVASHYRDRLDEACIDLPESIASAKPTDEPEKKAAAPATSKLVNDAPLETADGDEDTSASDSSDDAGDKKPASAPIRISGEPEVLEARVVITDEEDEVYEPPSEEDDDGDDLDLDVSNNDGNESSPPEQPPLLELDDEDDEEDNEFAGTQWGEPEADASDPAPPAPAAARPGGTPVIQLATTQVPESEAASADDEEPTVVEQRELTPTPAPRQTPPPLQAAMPSRGPAPVPVPPPAPQPPTPPATPRGDAAEDTLEGLTPGQPTQPAPETPANNNGPVEARQGVSMRTLGVTAAVLAVVCVVAIVVAAGGLALTGAGIGVYQLVSDNEQVAANPGPGRIVRPAPAPVAPRPRPTRPAGVWDSAMESGGNVYVSTGSAEWVLYESRKANDGVRYSGGMVNESCLSGAPGVHDATASCPKRERLY